LNLKALNFDPSSLIKSVETTEVMMGRLAASVSQGGIEAQSKTVWRLMH
jgi:hypothetical protein